MQVSEIFNKAVKLPVASRPAFLEETCGADAHLRNEIESLLRAHDDPHAFLGKSPERTTDFDVMAERTGSQIGPYALREQIGEGGFGLVFVAEQHQPIRRKVALKLIKPGMDTREVVARFEAERQALAMMDHPNIARVFDAGATETGRPFFVMELVKGVPITEYADANNMTTRERLELFLQVCQAVQHAHQKGVIHRDLKPSNILVAPHDGVPVVKVIDFGVAKALGQQLTEKTIYTRFAAMIGTPLYMSPEQAEVNQLDVDTRSDIYSLGVLLYELLTGATPFDKERLKRGAYDEIRRIIKDEEPPRPSTRLTSNNATLTATAARRGTEPEKLAGLVRGELDWIVMKALEKDRTRRYETATGLAKDVQRHLGGEAVEACPPTLGYRLRKSLRRNRAAVSIAAAFVGLVTIAGIVAGYLAVTADRARRGEAAERRRAEVREADAIAQRELAERERRRAEEEKRASEAVQAFLQDDLLRQADTLQQAKSMPLVGGEFEIKPNPTIRELLDRAASQLAAEQIEKKFPGMPFVQAEVLHALASAYGGVAETERGRTLIDRAVVLYRSVRGDADPATLKARFTQLKLGLGVPRERFDATMRSFVEDAARVFGPRDRMVLEARLTQAFAPLVSDRAAEAIANLKTLREELTATLGPTDSLTLMCGAYLAMSYLNDKQFAVAVREMETLRETAKGMAIRFDHPMLQQGFVMLAETYRASGNVNKAIEVYEEILDGWKRRGQPFHVNTWQPRHLVAWIYVRSGNLTKGAESFEANVAAAPSSLNAYFTLNALCEAESQLGRDDNALVRRARQALAAAIGARSADYKSWVTGHARIRLGQYLIRTKEFAEAEALLTAGLREMIDELPHVRDFSINAIPEGQASLLDLYRASNRPDKQIALLALTRKSFDSLFAKNLASGKLTATAVTLVETRVVSHIAADQHGDALALYREVNAKHPPADKLAADASFRLCGTVLNGYEAKLQKDRMQPWAELRIPTLERNLKNLRDGNANELPMLQATNAVAFGYLHAGRKADAVKAVEAVIARQKSNGWRTDADAVTSYGSTVKAAALADRPDLAVDVSSAVLAAVEKSHAKPSVLASATFHVGFAELHAGKHAEAEKHLREAVRLMAEAGLRKHWLAAKYKAWLGFALHDQKKYEEAEPMLTEAYAEWMERLAVAPTWEKVHPLLLSQRLASLYETVEKPGEAAKWKAISEKK